MSSADMTEEMRDTLEVIDLGDAITETKHAVPLGWIMDNLGQMGYPY